MVREAAKGKTNGKSASKNGQPNRQSPTSNITKIGSLNRFPDKEYANDLLHQVARLVAPLIHERGFKVGTLCEMFPKNANLLGLNVNHGQKILLRLRYHSNDRLFLPLGDIIGTFLHELTHNLYGPHDSKFYNYLDGLKERYELIQYGGASKGYVCEEEKLGRGYNGGGFVSERERRIRALSKVKYVGETKRLGTLTDSGIQRKTRANPIDVRNLRLLMLEAAERRAKDSKWCVGENESSVEPSNDELDIVYVDDEEEEEEPELLEQLELLNKPISSELLDIIDLTEDEDGVIVIDACEEDEKIPKSILRHESHAKPSSGRQVSFGLLPSLDEGKFDLEVTDTHTHTHTEQICYVASSSPRTFIHNEDKYPRRKLVADLDFTHIMRYSPKEDILIQEESLLLVEPPPPQEKKKPKRAPKKPTPKKQPSPSRKPPAKAKTKRTSKASKKKIEKETNSKPKKVVRTIEFSELL